MWLLDVGWEYWSSLEVPGPLVSLMSNATGLCKDNMWVRGGQNMKYLLAALDTEPSKINSGCTQIGAGTTCYKEASSHQYVLLAVQISGHPLSWEGETHGMILTVLYLMVLKYFLAHRLRATPSPPLPECRKVQSNWAYRGPADK